MVYNSFSVSLSEFENYGFYFDGTSGRKHPPSRENAASPPPFHGVLPPVDTRYRRAKPRMRRAHRRLIQFGSSFFRSVYALYILCFQISLPPQLWRVPRVRFTLNGLRYAPPYALATLIINKRLVPPLNSVRWFRMPFSDGCLKNRIKPPPVFNAENTFTRVKKVNKPKSPKRFAADGRN